MSSDNFRALFEQSRQGNSRSLGILLSEIEKNPAKTIQALPELFDGGKAVYRIGITGPPGAGKSTLISQLIGHFRKQDLAVAILAVDPSSPFTQGAILGDRIRYSQHFLDEKVFIRSMGTRGSLGGLSGSAYLALRLLDQMNFDVILIETVGVGQTELEIVNVADKTVVTLVPESGDIIQAMKAGLSEIADAFVVNKSDRDGADALVRELQAADELIGEASAEVFKTVATTGEGTESLAKALLAEAKNSEWKMARVAKSKLAQEARAILRMQLESDLQKRAAQIASPADLRKILQNSST